MIPEEDPPPAAVLSLDEEFVLSLARELVGAIRLELGAAPIARVQEAFAGAGAVADPTAGIAATVFRLRGARFFLQESSGSAGAIELTFLAD